MGRGERGRGGGPESQVAVEVEQAPPAPRRKAAHRGSLQEAPWPLAPCRPSRVPSCGRCGPVPGQAVLFGDRVCGPRAGSADRKTLDNWTEPRDAKSRYATRHGLRFKT